MDCMLRCCAVLGGWVVAIVVLLVWALWLSVWLVGMVCMLGCCAVLGGWVVAIGGLHRGPK